jgi:hypothetical protein
MAHNESSSALASVAISVELLDAGGAPLGERTVSLPLSVLQPGAVSPFLARFELLNAPAEARAKLESFLFSSESPVSIRVGMVYATHTPDEVFVRGTVQGDDARPLRVREAVVVWRDRSRSLAGLTVASLPGAVLPPDGSLPWIAQAPGASPGTGFEVFVAAIAAEDSGERPLVVADDLAWRVTSQGKGFATGAVRNAAEVPIYPQVAIAVSASDRLISLEILQSGIPLQPGESLIFAADQFPGLQATLESAGIEIGDLTLEAYVDAQPVPSNTGRTVMLAASIDQFEAIGSSVFLRGTVSNPDGIPLTRAMGFVSLRSTTGEPQSARWLELVPPPGQEDTQISIDLPLAAGVDPAMCEYDVRALGLPLSDPSG